MTLDEAWAEAEAALPKRWRFGISPYYPCGYEAYAYNIHRTPNTGLSRHSTGACYGDTAIEALQALTAKLRDRPEVSR